MTFIEVFLNPSCQIKNKKNPYQITFSSIYQSSKSVIYIKFGTKNVETAEVTSIDASNFSVSSQSYNTYMQKNYLANYLEALSGNDSLSRIISSGR